MIIQILLQQTLLFLLFFFLIPLCSVNGVKLGIEEDIVRRDIILSQPTFLAILNRQLKELKNGTDLVDEILSQIPSQPRTAKKKGTSQSDIYKQNGSIRLVLQESGTLANYFTHSIDPHSVMAAKLAGKPVGKWVWKQIQNTAEFNRHILLTPNDHFSVEWVAIAIGKVVADDSREGELKKEAIMSWAAETNSLEKIVFIPTNFTMNSMVDGAVELTPDCATEYQLLLELRIQMDKCLMSWEEYNRIGGEPVILSEVWQYFVSTYNLVEVEPNAIEATFVAGSSSGKLCSIHRKGFEIEKTAHPFSINNSCEGMKQVYFQILPIPNESTENPIGNLIGYFAYINETCIPIDFSDSGSPLYDLIVREAKKEENVKNYQQLIKTKQQKTNQISISKKEFSKELRKHLDYTASRVQKGQDKITQSDLMFLQSGQVLVKLRGEMLKFCNLPVVFPNYEDDNELERYVMFVLHQICNEPADDFIVTLMAKISSEDMVKEYEKVVRKAHAQFGTNRVTKCRQDIWVILSISVVILAVVSGYVLYIYRLKKKYPERKISFFSCGAGKS